jgi:hypothetical protein
VGLRDSSITRVAPVFSQLLARDPTGRSWLPALLSLPAFGNAQTAPTISGALVRQAWWPAERKLVPPPALLEYLVTNPPDGLAAVGRERGRLGAGDVDAQAEAFRLLRARDRVSAERAWYVLEGDTHVDAYLETDDAIVLAEGKRTERGPTTKTTWMPVRHQLLRNIDCVWDDRGAKAVFALFVVEGMSDGSVPPGWEVFARQTVTAEALEGSLPHRDSDEQHAIAAAFLGVTTWRVICTSLELEFGLLPDTVTLMRDAVG